jgi:FolB domain-containing protein
LVSIYRKPTCAQNEVSPLVRKMRPPIVEKYSFCVEDRDLTGFLASVSNGDEASIACEQGADFIDAKDPSRGALGALHPDAVRQIVAAVADRAPVSAVAGDLPMEPDIIRAAAEALCDTGIDYLKVGLFPGPQREACIEALAPLAMRIKLIGVMFADLDVDINLIPLMRQVGFAGVMIDTAEKNGKRLLDYCDLTALLQFVETAQARQLLAGLAGSLEPPDIPRLLSLSPDFLGFRGALCDGKGRLGVISSEATALVRALIPRRKIGDVEEQSMSRVDYGLLAAQCFSNDPRKGSGATERIFVHDLVLSARIGAYASEQTKPQRIRFNVDIDIKRLDHVAKDMRDVFSYDIVTDGIALILAAGHIALIETLAEQVAAMALAHPRVFRVTVRVEKLDVGPGSVGVEIVRERATEASEVLRLFPGSAPAAKRVP